MEEVKFLQLFDKQKEHFVSEVQWSSARKRIGKLKVFRDWILKNQKEIREALYQDLRKPEVEADITDIKPVLWEIDHACRNLEKWMKSDRVAGNLALIGTRSKIIYEPLGVVLILAPWNFPFNLTVGPVVSAIAAGNCVFAKPSEHTPQTSALIRKMVQELFDENEIFVCTGDHHVAEELLRLPFNHIFFTGSTEVGKKVMKAAAGHLSSVTLELGGMNPAIVERSANLKDAAQKLLFGKFMNAGQSCLSVNYILVDQSVHNDFIKILIEEYDKLRFDKKEFSRIVNHKHFCRIRSLIEQSVAAGAEPLLQGEMREEENYIAPTILNNVPRTAPVMGEEIFGPVLPVLPYKDLDEALSFINQKDRPLAFYIFSQTDDVINKAIQSTSAGTTCVNDTTLQFIHPNLPFGGVNQSGIGKSHGHAGFLAFSNARSVLRQRVGFTSFKLIYPPYGKRVKMFARLIMKYF